LFTSSPPFFFLPQPAPIQWRRSRFLFLFVARDRGGTGKTSPFSLFLFRRAAPRSKVHLGFGGRAGRGVFFFFFLFFSFFFFPSSSRKIDPLHGLLFLHLGTAEQTVPFFFFFSSSRFELAGGSCGFFFSLNDILYFFLLLLFFSLSLST